MQGAAADDTPTQPLVELLVERHDGKAMADLYMQEFGQAHREGVVDRAVAIQLLKVWRARSILADADVSYGLAGYISEKLGVLPVEWKEKRFGMGGAQSCAAAAVDGRGAANGGRGGRIEEDRLVQAA